MRRAWWWLRNHPNVITAVLLVATNVAGWRAFEAERRDRCVNSRTDTQSAIVAVVAEFQPDDLVLRARAAETVAEALPVDEC